MSITLKTLERRISELESQLIAKAQAEGMLESDIALPSDEMRYPFKSDDWWNMLVRRRRTDASKRTVRLVLKHWKSPDQWREFVTDTKTTDSVRLARLTYVSRIWRYTEGLFVDQREIRRLCKQAREAIAAREEASESKSHSVVSDLIDILKNQTPPAINLSKNPLDIFGFYLPARDSQTIKLRGYVTSASAVAAGADDRHEAYYLLQSKTLVFHDLDKHNGVFVKCVYPKSILSEIVQSKPVVDTAYEMLDAGFTSDGEYLWRETIPIHHRVTQSLTPTFKMFRSHPRFLNNHYRAAWRAICMGDNRRAAALDRWLTYSKNA